MICFCERKLKNDFELPFVTYIRIFFSHCDVTFPYKEILSFFGHCHVTFPYMELLSFFGRFVQKVILSCFSDSFVQKTKQQQNRGVDRMPSVAKKRLMRKKFKKNLLSYFQMVKSTQTSGSAFADRIEQVKKTKIDNLTIF